MAETMLCLKMMSQNHDNRRQMKIALTMITLTMLTATMVTIRSHNDSQNNDNNLTMIYQHRPPLCLHPSSPFPPACPSPIPLDSHVVGAVPVAVGGGGVGAATRRRASIIVFQYPSIENCTTGNIRIPLSGTFNIRIPLRGIGVGWVGVAGPSALRGGLEADIKGGVGDGSPTRKCVWS